MSENEVPANLLFIPRVLQSKKRKSEEPHDGGPAKKVQTDNGTESIELRQDLDVIACGLELIFSDFSCQDDEFVEWLGTHTEETGEAKGYLSLLSLTQHPYFNPSWAKFKPSVSPRDLAHALKQHPSEFLEVHADGEHVRRKPSTYPLPHLSAVAHTATEEDGLPFWDQRAIYVEPHKQNFANNPVMVAWYLQKHGNLRKNWLPIQAVRTIDRENAFVVLSGLVPAKLFNKWHEQGTPENWKVMTKKEHDKRCDEYERLLEAESNAPPRKEKKLDYFGNPVSRNYRKGPKDPFEPRDRSLLHEPHIVLPGFEGMSKARKRESEKEDA